jgi:hypothetical protein
MVVEPPTQNNLTHKDQQYDIIYTLVKYFIHKENIYKLFILNPMSHGKLRHLVGIW